MERLDDGPGEEQRQQHRSQHGGGDHDAQSQPFGAHRPGDVAGIFGREQAAAILHARRGRDHEGAVGRIAVHRLRLACLAGEQQFRPGIGAIHGGLFEIGRAVGEDDAVHRLVQKTRDMAPPPFFRRQGQPITRSVHRKAVGDQPSVRPITANTVAGLPGEGSDQRIMSFSGCCFQADGEQLQFARRLIEARVHDPGAIAVQIEEAARQQGQREHVDRQDARRQADPARPAQPTVLRVTLRRIGIRRHRAYRLR